MYAIATLALKDLRLLTRDWAALFWMFGFPLMFALFFGSVFSSMGGGISAFSVAVVDEDHTAGSKAFAERIAKSPALKVQSAAKQEAADKVLAGKLVAYVVLKKGFGDTESFFGGADTFIEVGIDPARKAEKEMLRGVLLEASFSGMQDLFDKPAQAAGRMMKMRRQIADAKDLSEERKQTFLKFYDDLEGFMRNVQGDALGGKAAGQFQAMRIDIKDVSASGRGPGSAWEITFPSSILWGIMGCVATFAVSLVSERLQGTFQRLCVAPLSRAQILAGKGLACWLGCTGVAAVLLAIGVAILGVRVQDPAQLVLAVAANSLFFTGFMMLISTLGKTEAAVAGAGWGVLMPCAMLGGAMVPLFAMPAWMQTAGSISPVKWSILALEGAIWRGYSLTDMLLPCCILVGMGVVCYTAGVLNLARQDR